MSKMKKPKKIRRGDIFVNSLGIMTVITNVGKEFIDYEFSGHTWATKGSGTGAFLELFFIKYYLGNIQDIKPEGK